MYYNNVSTVLKLYQTLAVFKNIDHMLKVLMATKQKLRAGRKLLQLFELKNITQLNSVLIRLHIHINNLFQK